MSKSKYVPLQADSGITTLGDSSIVNSSGANGTSTGVMQSGGVSVSGGNSAQARLLLSNSNSGRRRGSPFYCLCIPAFFEDLNTRFGHILPTRAQTVGYSSGVLVRRLQATLKIYIRFYVHSLPLHGGFLLMVLFLLRFYANEIPKSLP
jgi:hypothetical protein